MSAEKVPSSGDGADKNDTPTNPAKDEDPQYPKGMKLGVIMFALCLSVFCVALDNTIIATAIPRITDQFHALRDIGWYGSAYLLTTCAFQLFYGKLYSRFSVKGVFLVALSIFEIGSLICATSPNSLALIIGVCISLIYSRMFTQTCGYREQLPVSARRESSLVL